MSASLFQIGLALAVGVLTVLAFDWLWPAVLPARPDSGERGRRRKEALAKHGLFRRFELLMRVLSTRVATWPMGGLRARAEAATRRSGRVLGMNGDDLMAISIIGAAFASVLGGFISKAVFEEASCGLIIGALVGACFPWFKVGDAAKRRLVAVCRGLPGAIDLIALSMEAGLDFPGAVGQVAARLTSDNPLRFELEHLLHKLTLGRSRAEALEELALRVPEAPVRQFTSSVIQAEKRGTPLAEVLATQATVMRTQRSQRAEQAAARAAVLIIGPLMLIFVCVFIIILGPFVIRYIRGELF
jgi:tight adherence protein C